MRSPGSKPTRLQLKMVRGPGTVNLDCRDFSGKEERAIKNSNRTIRAKMPLVLTFNLMADVKDVPVLQFFYRSMCLDTAVSYFTVLKHAKRFKVLALTKQKYLFSRSGSQHAKTRGNLLTSMPLPILMNNYPPHPCPKFQILYI